MVFLRREVFETPSRITLESGVFENAVYAVQYRIAPMKL